MNVPDVLIRVLVGQWCRTVSDDEAEFVQAIAHKVGTSRMESESKSADVTGAILITLGAPDTVVAVGMIWTRLYYRMSMVN